MEVNVNNDPLDQQHNTIAFDKDIDHDVLLMNAKNKNKFVESNTINEDDSIQLRTYSNLDVNTGIRLSPLSSDSKPKVSLICPIDGSTPGK